MAHAICNNAASAYRCIYPIRKNGRGNPFPHVSTLFKNFLDYFGFLIHLADGMFFDPRLGKSAYLPLKKHVMKSLTYLTLLTLITILSGCAVAGGIFKAGMYWGIFLVVGIIALIIYMISRAGKK